MDSLAAAASAVVLWLALYLSWHYLKYGFGPYKGGLPVYPFLGILPSFMAHVDDMLDFLTETFERSPNMAITGVAPGFNWFLTANPAHIQHILKDNFANYPKGWEIKDTTVDLLGHGIFTSDGEAWRQQRKMASYEFSTNSLRYLLQESIKEEVDGRLLPTLTHFMEKGEAFDLQDVVLRFTLDSICQVGFGIDLKVLSPDLPKTPFAASFDRAAVLNAVRHRVPRLWWKVLKLLNVGSEREFAEEMRVVDRFLRGVVEKRRRDLEAVGKVKGTSESVEEFSLGRSDLLSRMMLLRELDHNHTLSDDFLRDACLNFLVAGRDTTAVTLSWFFWRLTQHPQVEERVVAELRSIVERRRGDRDAAFTFEELKLMNYLQAALNETLRLHSAVPGDLKVSENADVLPDGTRIGKGWKISYIIYSVGRMTRVWGADAMEFKPERWLNEQGELRSESPFKFPAFNGGPRLCLGKDMAYTTMKALASNVLRKFTFKLVQGHPVQYVIGLTLLMKHGLQVTVHPR